MTFESLERFEGVVSGTGRDLLAYAALLLAASLNDIVRFKKAADRPQDRQDVVIIREMLRSTDGS